MAHWINTYPHRVYASVLLLNNKVIDYKIGERYWETPMHVTLKGQISLDDLCKCQVRHTSWEANSPEKHDDIFNNLAKAWINNQQS